MNTFIFDLDGTLLPMPSQEKFLEAYFGALTHKMAKYGKNPQELIKAVWTGTKSMLDNDGAMTNEQRYWTVFCHEIGEEGRQLEPVFDDFYRNEFIAAKNTTLTHPNAKACIDLLKEKGYMIVLATNPLFPRIATHNRIRWAGLSPEDFDYITTYENSSYCKPNLMYYKEVLSNISKQASECIMVGNDVKEDMCAAALGMETYLLKECLICPPEEDISHFRQGDFHDLLDYIKGLPSII